MSEQDEELVALWTSGVQCADDVSNTQECTLSTMCTIHMDNMMKCEYTNMNMEVW